MEPRTVRFELVAMFSKQGAQIAEEDTLGGQFIAEVRRDAPSILMHDGTAKLAPILHERREPRLLTLSPILMQLESILFRAESP